MIVTRGGAPPLNGGGWASRRRGLTLLELLLVVFILSMLAFSAASLTNTMDEQFRYEETQRRLEEIRRGVVGDPTRTVNGQPEVSGFVADVGELPQSVVELTEGSRWNGSELTPLPPWTYYEKVGLWAGWRGPYVSVMPETLTGMRAYRDGWGNPGSLPNFGWKRFEADPVTRELLVQSFGSDGPDGIETSADEPYRNDYPPDPVLVKQNDYLVNLRGWSVWVKFSAPPPQPVANNLRLRVNYPRINENGEINWPEPWPPENSNLDEVNYLSLHSPDLQQQQGQGQDQRQNTTTVEFPFTDNNPGVPKRIPHGIRSLVVIDDRTGDVYEDSLNDPFIVHFVARAALPWSGFSDPLFVWDVDGVGQGGGGSGQ